MSRDSNNGFDEWGGYMEAKYTKLEEQFTDASRPYHKSDLFEGISIYVNGFTDPSADELKRIMMTHGGVFHHYERAHTTFIIASNLPDVKVRNLDTAKFINAQWVVDCVREQRVLDYKHYLLYTNQKTSQPRLTFTKIEKNDKSDKYIKSYAGVKQELQLGDKQTPNNNQLNITEGTELEKKCVSPVDVKERVPPADAVKERVPPADAVKERVPSNTSSGKLVQGSGMAARTANDPKFLNEFFDNSRLHHIATLGAGFKQYVSELRSRHAGAIFPARLLLKEALAIQAVCQNDTAPGHCIMHIDMDCFFVSVGLRKYPHLRGKPVAVTHSKGGASASNVPVHPGANRQAEKELFAKRFDQHLHNNKLADKVRGGFDATMSLSEIASCSYEARAKGVYNGMFVGHAMKLCPDLRTIPYDFEAYKKVAFSLYDIIAQYTLNIEAVSCDEMFVDLSDVLAELNVAPMDFVTAIRNQVRQRTGCPCSAGIGANKLQARMATKRAKPDGQYHLLSTDVQAYMADIPIDELPGVGSSTSFNLNEAGLRTCGDLQKVSLFKIQMHVGKKFGETLHQFCRGVDNRSLVYDQVRKSISAEVNYGIRFTEYATLEEFLRRLCVEVHKRLMDIKRKTKCVTLKVMVRAKNAPVEPSKFMGHGVCDNVTKSVPLSEFTSDLDVITRTILTIMKALSVPPNELRGIGVHLGKLDDPNEGKEKKENVIKDMFSKALEKLKVAPKKREDNTLEMVVKEKSATATGTKKKTAAANTTTASNNMSKWASVLRNKTQISFSNDTTTKKPYSARLGDFSITKERRKRPDVQIIQKNDIATKFIKLDNNYNNYENNRGNTTNNCDNNRSNITNNYEYNRNNAKNYDPNDLPPNYDRQMFESLPEEVRADVLHDLKMQKLNRVPLDDEMPSTSKAGQVRPQSSVVENMQVDATFLENLPPGLRAEVEMDIRLFQQQQKRQQQANHVARLFYSGYKPTAALDASLSKRIGMQNIFEQQQGKELLLEWLQSADAPELYDVDMITGQALELVRAQRISGLREHLLYLCRLINNLKSTAADCGWHLAYNAIVEAIQIETGEMFSGGMLFIGESIKCEHCQD